MRFNRWWPDEGTALAAPDEDRRLSTHRRHVLRPSAGTRLSSLTARAHRADPAPNASDDTAVPGPRERSAGWEVRTRDDLLYFLRGGRPRFVMSEAMARRGYATIESLLSSEPDPVRAAAPAPYFAPVPIVPEHERRRPADLALRREPHARGAAAARREFAWAPALLAASFAVLAVGAVLAVALLAPGVVGPQLVGRSAPDVQPAPAPVTSLAVPQGAPTLVPVRAPVQPAAMRPIAAAHRTVAPHPAVPQKTTQAAMAHFPVSRSMRFLVVSESLPVPVAVRRVSALVADGVTEIPQVMSLSADRASLFYGSFASKADAETLASHVRTLGYTAMVVTQ